MSPLSQITPLILTYNEMPNIGRSLARLTWAKEILIVDSGSTDGTRELAKTFPQTRVVHREFDSFARQCNFGLEQIRTSWVLSMDADYLVSQELTGEIARVELNGETAGYEVAFRYWVLGRPLRACLYPPRTVLFRRDAARYFDEGHSHRVRVEGPVRRISGWMEHDDRKPLERWLYEQNRYALAEARYLAQTPKELLDPRDRLRRRILFAPFLVGVYTLFGQGLIVNGWEGFYYAFQRALAETLLSLRLMEVTRMRKPEQSEGDERRFIDMKREPVAK
jgi:glycosyltransferase involved in cell wall biosynthesis